MPANQLPTVQALGLRQPDVVAVKHLHHLIPSESGNGGHGEQTQGYRRDHRGMEESAVVKEIGKNRNTEGKCILQKDQKNIAGNADAQDGKHRAEAIQEFSPVQCRRNPQQQSHCGSQQNRQSADAKRIADGCDNFCTFCAIPYIRGRFKSRKIEDVLEEAEILAKKGFRELIVIAQDTTKYGTDIYGEPKLAELLEELCKIDGVEWIRFLYSYPETITDELIQVVKSNDKICKYFDIPMQHCSNQILKSMNRKTTKERMMKLIEKLRREIPNVIIRSTLMVGFPGETEKDYDELFEFVKWAKFDKLGCFTYSKEEGTSAEKIPNHVHYRTKQSRYNKLMKLQQEISKQNLSKFIGKEFKTLIEDAYVNGDGELYFVGRTYMDVPEIDGYVYIKGNKELQNQIELNTFLNCKITEVREYDLIGEVL